MAGQSYRLGRGGGSLSRAGQIAVRSARSARASAHHPPPFFGNQKKFRPLPKMRHIFHSGEDLR
jgi:hypothetical protein